MKLLSKSSINLYLQCPFKWKKVYVDEIKSIPSPAQERGIKIHEKIEKFYKDPKPDLDLKHLIAFELRRIKEMIKTGKFDKKYFYPLFQELKLENEELGLKGIIDAVYINPKDDNLIIIDFKTGKFKEGSFRDYLLELAIYTELLNHSKKIDEKVKYVGIYFIDANKLFFEEIKEEHIKEMYEIVELVRKGIENKNFEPEKNQYCFFCQFKSDCPLKK